MPSDQNSLSSFPYSGGGAEPSPHYPVDYLFPMETAESVLRKLLQNPDTHVLTDALFAALVNLAGGGVPSLPMASEAERGVVVLATLAEVIAGIDDGKAITAKKLKGALAEREAPDDGRAYVRQGKAWVDLATVEVIAPGPVVMGGGTTAVTLSAELAGRRVILNSPGRCTVYLPATGLPEGFECMVRNAGGGPLVVSPLDGARVENDLWRWSDPTQYGSILLESAQGANRFYLLGGLEADVDL